MFHSYKHVSTLYTGLLIYHIIIIYHISKLPFFSWDNCYKWEFLSISKSTEDNHPIFRLSAPPSPSGACGSRAGRRRSDRWCHPWTRGRQAGHGHRKTCKNHSKLVDFSRKMTEKLSLGGFHWQKMWGWRGRNDAASLEIESWTAWILGVKLEGFLKNFGERNPQRSGKDSDSRWQIISTLW